MGYAFHKIWFEQCDAAEGIRETYGLEKAIGYLIGEKLLNFIEASDKHSEFKEELPEFVERIKEIFQPYEITPSVDGGREVLGKTRQKSAISRPERNAMGHYCRICGRVRANGRFSGKGHRIHACKDCSRLPKEEIRRREVRDDIAKLNGKNPCRMDEKTGSPSEADKSADPRPSSGRAGARRSSLIRHVDRGIVFRVMVSGCRPAAEDSEE